MAFIFELSGCKAKKVVTSLEEKQHKEALLLQQRIRLCEAAGHLFDKVGSMGASELHRTLQPLVAEGIALPLSLQVKLVNRRCLECMESDMTMFMAAWKVWDNDEDDEEISLPIAPRKGSISRLETF